MSSISLIIPTYNRQETVIQTLNYLKLQNCEDYELVVVDQTKSAHQCHSHARANMALESWK